MVKRVILFEVILVEMILVVFVPVLVNCFSIELVDVVVDNKFKREVALELALEFGIIYWEHNIPI